MSPLGLGTNTRFMTTGVRSSQPKKGITALIYREHEESQQCCAPFLRLIWAIERNQTQFIKDNLKYEHLKSLANHMPLPQAKVKVKKAVGLCAGKKIYVEP